MPGPATTDRTVERHLRAMSDHPEVTLTLSLPSGWDHDDASGPGSWRPQGLPIPVEGVVDGRALAEALLLTGGNPIPTPTVVAVRTASLDGGVLPTSVVGTDDSVLRGAEWYRWMVGLLVQGPAWIDPEPGVEVAPPNSGRALWEQWPSVIGAGRELGLLDRPADLSRALIAWTRRAAALLHAYPNTGAGERDANTDGAAEIVVATIDRWHALMADEVAVTSPLPLHAALETTAPPSADLASLTEHISVHEVSRIASVEEWAWDVAANSNQPIVLVRTGELLDVADRSQLLEWLSEGVPPTGARIATPFGAEVRVLPPAVTGSSPRLTDGVPLVHSLRAARANFEAAPDWLRRQKARSHAIRTFVVAAPGYTTRHGGIVALHRLCDRLNAIGYDAFLYPFEHSHDTRPGWLTPLLRGRSAKDMVAIYPETVSGNELGADRVVRWLLNRPGRIHGNTMDESPDDLVVAYSMQISPEYPILNVPIIDPQVFFPKDRPGTGSLLWIGKGVLPPGFDRSATRLITNDWPCNRPDFGRVLRSADVLYTCDWLTSVIDEALMCGTPVVFVGEQEWSRDEIVMRPGMAWEDGDLDRARAEVGEYYAQCVEGAASVDVTVEEFVQLVNDHFDPVATGHHGLLA